MKTHDAVVILGSRPQDDSWRLPSHIGNSLDTAIAYYRSGVTPYIVVSGKWTINFDALHIMQPFNECDIMADYLLKHGIPNDAILREADSKDTISNIYYLKRQIFEPHRLKNLLFIAAEARLPRIQFLGERILGPSYNLQFQGVDYEPSDVSPNEQRTLAKQRDFIAPMKSGDDSWLDGKFYDDPFYIAVKARAKRRAAHEPLIHLAKPPTSS